MDRRVLLASGLSLIAAKAMAQTSQGYGDPPPTQLPPAAPRGQSYPQSQYPARQYPQSQYPQSQYPQSQSPQGQGGYRDAPPANAYRQDDDRGGYRGP